MNNTETEDSLDETIDKLIVSIAKTMENPPADLVELIGGIDTPENSEDFDSIGTDDSIKTMGAELQALIDVVMDE